jgi:hypothetical protein
MEWTVSMGVLLLGFYTRGWDAWNVTWTTTPHGMYIQDMDEADFEFT